MRIVAGTYKGKKIASPLSAETRPTSDRARETLFNILLHNPAVGPFTLSHKTVLDVFAGTGALGLEAFSRGAQSVMFVENSSHALKALRTNLAALELAGSCIIPEDARHLSKAPFSFDLIFLDPPYEKGLILPTLSQLLEQGWLGKKSLVVLEISHKEPLSLPPFLRLVLDRIEGAARFLFCRVATF